MSTLLRRPSTALLLIFISIVTFLVYLPGLGGDFIFDDIINISLNYRSHMSSLSLDSLRQVWNSGVASDLGRSLAMLSFGLNYYFSGLDPFYYKLTNVVLHLVTALAIFCLTRELLNIKGTREPTIPKQYLAILIAACWALHPLHVSTVLYTVQRMTQLSALFSVLAILMYCRVRAQNDLSKVRSLLMQGCIAILILLGLLGKENAVLAVPLIAVVEYCLFGLRTDSDAQRFFQRSFFTLFLLIPGVLVFVYLLWNPDYILAAYSIRDFNLFERLLTQTRVLWEYLSWILTADPRAYTFYYENYPISRSLVSPLTTLFACLGIGALIAAVFTLRKSLPWLSFGIGFFLAGHALESTVFALELVFEHRNYLPSYGILLGLLATLFTAPLPILSKPLVSAFSAVFVALLVHGTYSEAVKWSSTPNFLLTLLNRAPDSYRIHYTLGHVYFTSGMSLQNKDYLQSAAEHFTRAISLDERNIAAHIGLVMADDALGRTSSQNVIDDLLRRTQEIPLTTSSLIAFINLERCYFTNNCDQEQTINLFAQAVTAVARNTAMEGPEKQAFLAEVAGDLLLTFGRVSDALALYYLAADLSGELNINDVRVLFLELDRRNYEAARAHLVKAQQKPGSNASLRGTLESIEERINAIPNE